MADDSFHAFVKELFTGMGPVQIKRMFGGAGVYADGLMFGLLADDTIHIQVTWKLATIPSYWKTEDYEMTLSGDETKLRGSYRIKSSGKGEYAEDKLLFKQ